MHFRLWNTLQQTGISFPKRQNEFHKWCHRQALQCKPQSVAPRDEHEKSHVSFQSSYWAHIYVYAPIAAMNTRNWSSSETVQMKIKQGDGKQSVASAYGHRLCMAEDRNHSEWSSSSRDRPSAQGLGSRSQFASATNKPEEKKLPGRPCSDRSKNSWHYPCFTRIQLTRTVIAVSTTSVRTRNVPSHLWYSTLHL